MSYIFFLSERVYVLFLNENIIFFVEIFSELHSILYQESAVAGEAAGIAIGLVHEIIHSLKNINTFLKNSFNNKEQ
jgi:hypothetical protein